MGFVFRGSILVTASLAFAWFAMTSLVAIAQTPAIDEALAKRMAEEKEARRACKVEICKAFQGTDVAPVSCSFTKTWLRDEILARVVGGSYVWQYGHAQCTTAVKLDAEKAGNSLKGPELTLAFGKHDLNCSVEDGDPAKGEAFKVRVSLSPTVVFKGGKVQSVDFGAVETDGSRVAAAAITSALAIDQLSGVISRGAAKEMNDFLFEKCPADGVRLKPPAG